MKTSSLNLVVIMLFQLNGITAYAQTIWTVTGTVRDASTNDLLSGTSISVQHKTTGTITDQLGHFQIQIPESKEAVLLLISYVGYETQKIEVTGGSTNIDIKMTKNQQLAKEVVVTASRISETILEAPVTILKMDANAVKEIPSENFYASLSGYKGVDVITNSILYKTINTRGFNNNANFRLAQLIDGVDNSLPGLGWPLGNVLGATDLDVEKVELVPGPASALYGANAFNGLLSVTTKDPFRYQGIAATVKTGVNHLGTDAHDPALYSDLQLRYAKAFNDRFAFKVNVGYLSGDDWLITDSSDIYKDVTADERGSDNPARDAVNIYGDEVARVDWVTDKAGAKVDVSRTGYDATELIDNSSYSAKINTALYYKLNDRLQLSYDFNYAKATTSYSSLSFFNLKNISMYTNKLELTGPRFFIRTAAVFNDLGDTYNASVLATAINKDWQPDTDWFNAYKQAYYGEVDGVTSYDFNAARNYADSGRLFPGTDAFNQVMETQKSIPFSNGGAKVIDRSSRYIAQGEYDFSYLIKVFDLIAGADYRLTRLNSEGTIFIDEPGEPLYINQYAGYAQATKQIFKDRLKLLAALRYDKADNFKGVWAPRFAAVYHPDNQNYFRASYQQGFRLPDPQLQFIDIVLSNRHRLGGTAVVDAPYHSRTNSFTGSSVTEFKDSINKFLVTHPNQLDSAVNRFQGILQKSSYDYIQPEKVRTFEVGYRRLLGDEKIYADINYFHNNYSGFIYSTVLVVTDSGGTQNAAAIDTAGHAIYAGGVENFQTVVNAADKVLVNGIEIGTSILLPKGYILSGNLTWIHSSVKPGDDEPGIRTPPLKSNLAISNSDLIKNLGFMINWRWTDAINNWSNVSDDKSIDNSLPAYSIIDAQVSYHLPKAATTIKAGASNLLNYYHQDFAQGISVGGIYYVSLTYDGIFK